MEDIIVELTMKQELGDKLAKAVAGGIVCVLAKAATEKTYDKVMAMYRLKKAMNTQV